MGKCSGLGCSVYDDLKMLVESDMAGSEKAKTVDQNEKREQDTREVLARIIERLESLPD
jgi:DNA-binding MurR/RpiR family transcriptional regulator